MIVFETRSSTPWFEKNERYRYAAVDACSKKELDASASWYLAWYGYSDSHEEPAVEKLFVDRPISSRGSDLHMTEICKGIEGVQVVLTDVLKRLRE